MHSRGQQAQSLHQGKNQNYQAVDPCDQIQLSLLPINTKQYSMNLDPQAKSQYSPTKSLRNSTQNAISAQKLQIGEGISEYSVESHRQNRKSPYFTNQSQHSGLKSNYYQQEGGNQLQLNLINQKNEDQMLQQQLAKDIQSMFILSQQQQAQIHQNIQTNEANLNASPQDQFFFPHQLLSYPMYPHFSNPSGPYNEGFTSPSTIHKMLPTSDALKYYQSNSVLLGTTSQPSQELIGRNMSVQMKIRSSTSHHLQKPESTKDVGVGGGDLNSYSMMMPMNMWSFQMNELPDFRQRKQELQKRRSENNRKEEKQQKPIFIGYSKKGMGFEKENAQQLLINYKSSLGEQVLKVSMDDPLRVKHKKWVQERERFNQQQSQLSFQPYDSHPHMNKTESNTGGGGSKTGWTPKSALLIEFQEPQIQKGMQLVIHENMMSQGVYTQGVESAVQGSSVNVSNGQGFVLNGVSRNILAGQGQSVHSSMDKNKIIYSFNKDSKQQRHGHSRKRTSKSRGDSKISSSFSYQAHGGLVGIDEASHSQHKNNSYSQISNLEQKPNESALFIKDDSFKQGKKSHLHADSVNYSLKDSDKEEMGLGGLAGFQGSIIKEVSTFQMENEVESQQSLQMEHMPARAEANEEEYQEDINVTQISITVSRDQKRINSGRGSTLLNEPIKEDRNLKQQEQSTHKGKERSMGKNGAEKSLDKSLDSQLGVNEGQRDGVRINGGGFKHRFGSKRKIKGGNEKGKIGKGGRNPGAIDYKKKIRPFTGNLKQISRDLSLSKMRMLSKDSSSNVIFQSKSLLLDNPVYQHRAQTLDKEKLTSSLDQQPNIYDENISDLKDLKGKDLPIVNISRTVSVNNQFIEASQQKGRIYSAERFSGEKSVKQRILKSPLKGSELKQSLQGKETLIIENQFNEGESGDQMSPNKAGSNQNSAMKVRNLKQFLESQLSPSHQIEKLLHNIQGTTSYKALAPQEYNSKVLDRGTIQSDTSKAKEKLIDSQEVKLITQINPSRKVSKHVMSKLQGKSLDHTELSVTNSFGSRTRLAQQIQSFKLKERPQLIQQQEYLHQYSINTQNREKYSSSHVSSQNNLLIKPGSQMVDEIREQLDLIERLSEMGTILESRGIEYQGEKGTNIGEQQQQVSTLNQTLKMEEDERNVQSVQVKKRSQMKQLETGQNSLNRIDQGFNSSSKLTQQPTEKSNLKQVNGLSITYNSNIYNRPISSPSNKSVHDPATKRTVLMKHRTHFQTNSLNVQTGERNGNLRGANKYQRKVAQIEFCSQDDLTYQDLDVKELKEDAGFVKQRKMTDLPRHSHAPPQILKKNYELLEKTRQSHHHVQPSFDSKATPLLRYQSLASNNHPSALDPFQPDLPMADLQYSSLKGIGYSNTRSGALSNHYQTQQAFGNTDMRQYMEQDLSYSSSLPKFFQYYNNGGTVIIREQTGKGEGMDGVDIQDQFNQKDGAKNIKIPALVHFKNLHPHQELISQLTTLMKDTAGGNQCTDAENWLPKGQSQTRQDSRNQDRSKLQTASSNQKQSRLAKTAAQTKHGVYKGFVARYPEEAVKTLNQMKQRQRETGKKDNGGKKKGNVTVIGIKGESYQKAVINELKL